MMLNIDVSGAVSLYGIIGKPLGHSRSPLLHNSVFAMLKMNAIYLPWEIGGEDLPGFVAAMRVLPIAGASVTIPHKESIMALIDNVTPRARRAGAVNTLYRADGEVHGDNTDIAGFMAPLAGRHGACKKALVLGAGGAARAVLAGLAGTFAGEIFICARNDGKSEKLAGEAGAGFAPWARRGALGADLVINTTPLGMLGRFERETPFPAEGFAKPGGLAYDLVYNPPRTVFMLQAEAAGWEALGGADMFLRQGLEQIRLWTGQELRVEDLPPACVF